jgi:DNA-binding transcriptional MocR family regulator
MLADFLEQGHYVRHLRRVRTVAAERYNALMHALSAS